MQVFIRAYETEALDKHIEAGNPVDILCPLDSIAIQIKGEVCTLAVAVGVVNNIYYMSEKQYNHLILSLKEAEAKDEVIYYLDASTK